MDAVPDRVYGYHTFILPFTWKMPGVSVDREYQALKEVFENNPEWENTNLRDETDITSKPDYTDYEDRKGFYKEFQYFYPFVRKSIYGYEDDICANYLLRASRNNGTYHIIKGDNHYVLNINAVRVRLVNSGVALFILECENHGTDGNGNPQTDISAIKNINDYGRRITVPFIDPGFRISADALEIKISGIGEYREDFETFSKEVDEHKIRTKEDVALTHMCGFIKQLMSLGSDYDFTSRPAENRKEIQVFPALDDRMYVAFAVEEKNAVGQISSLDAQGEFLYKTNDAISKSLYELAYADPQGGCSCPEREMRTDLIEKALYKRWLSKPSESTAYTITAMGFGMVSSAETGFHLYETFITCYFQMVYIALIQRASIVKFNREASDIARHFIESKRRISRKEIRSIMGLQERHAAFDNQLLFSEVSSEQQAIEMYEMLKETFFLEKENEKLDKNLTSLYEITDTNLNSIVNTSVEFLTWISIVLSGGALLYSILFASDVIITSVEQEQAKGLIEAFANQKPSVWVFLGIMFVVSVMLFILAKIKNRRK